MTCRRILVVDDDQDVRETMQEALEFSGYNVVTASNGREAIEALRRIDTPCLILLDLMMPVMNGWEFLEARKNDDVLAQIPVAVVSAAGLAASSARSTATTLMRKPVDLDALLDLVKSYCDDSAAEMDWAKQAA